jgi:anti-sigma-K factor RskA
MSVDGSVEGRDPAELADEYVLGLLDPGERREVEARLARDPDLAARVGAARDRFLPLDEGCAPLTPPPDLWSRIEAGLDGAARRAGPPAAAGVAAGPAAGAARRARGGRWSAPRRALAALALAASLAGAFWLGSLTSALHRAAVVAVLADGQGNPVALVESTRRNGVRIVFLAEPEAAPGAVYQVWTKPDPDGPPVSLGVLEEADGARLRAPDLPAPAPAQLYEITVEPPGGSPTGLPTGPIFGVGTARAPL